jgi:hypothetical protein
MTTTLYLVSALETAKDAMRRFERFGGSAERVRYWKVGVTDKANPLHRDRARYQEVFRAVVFEDLLWTEDSIRRHIECGFSLDDIEGVKPGDVEQSSKRRAEFVEWYVRRAFNQIATPIGRESLDVRAPLDAVLELFDQMVEWDASGLMIYVNPERTLEEQIELHKTFHGRDWSDELPLWQRLDALMRAICTGIESAMDAAGSAPAAPEPMWA